MRGRTVKMVHTSGNELKKKCFILVSGNCGIFFSVRAKDFSGKKSFLLSKVADINFEVENTSPLRVQKRKICFTFTEILETFHVSSSVF